VLKAIVAPSQKGPLLEAVGVAGSGVTTTVVSPAGDVQPSTVTVTEYVPAIAADALVIAGSRSEDVNPFGPVHEYMAPTTAGVLREIVPSSQNGPLFDADGAAGMGLIATLTGVASFTQPLLSVTVSRSWTVPEAPAVNVTVSVVLPPVIDPLTIDHAYAVMPAGAVAVLPVAFAQTEEDAEITGAGPLQSVSA
jgi:hypothetical protein